MCPAVWLHARAQGSATMLAINLPRSSSRLVSGPIQQKSNQASSPLSSPSNSVADRSRCPYSAYIQFKQVRVASQRGCGTVFSADHPALIPSRIGLCIRTRTVRRLQRTEEMMPSLSHPRPHAPLSISCPDPPSCPHSHAPAQASSSARPAKRLGIGPHPSAGRRSHPSAPEPPKPACYTFNIHTFQHSTATTSIHPFSLRRMSLVSGFNPSLVGLDMSSLARPPITPPTPTQTNTDSPATNLTTPIAPARQDPPLSPVPRAKVDGPKRDGQGGSFLGVWIPLRTAKTAPSCFKVKSRVGQEKLARGDTGGVNVLVSAVLTRSIRSEITSGADPNRDWAEQSDSPPHELSDKQKGKQPQQPSESEPTTVSSGSDSDTVSSNLVKFRIMLVCTELTLASLRA